MKALLIYFIVINIFAFLIMGIDKYKAQRHKWRVSELSIFTIGLVGGALGVFIGMGMFHHKTKHLKFTLGIPLVLLLNIIMFGYLLKKLGLI